MGGDAFTRQLRLLQLLETRRAGLEPEEAAEELGSGRRTVYRDFDVLQRAGFPLRSEIDGKRARWRIDEGYRNRLQLSLSWSEVRAPTNFNEAPSRRRGDRLPGTQKIAA